MWTVTEGSGRDGHEGDQAITKGVLLQIRPQQPVLIPIIGRLASIYAIGQSVPDRGRTPGGWQGSHNFGMSTVSGSNRVSHGGGQ